MMMMMMVMMMEVAVCYGNPKKLLAHFLEWQGILIVGFRHL